MASASKIWCWWNHAIAVELLTGEERSWIDAYHARVLKIVGPQLEGEALEWLEAACAPL
jgi:Xaa-Pro aminopeptidase